MTQALLDGKVLVVTGGGRGIGREIALAAAEAGARVIVNDIGAGLDGQREANDPAEETIALIAAAGGEAEIDRNSVSEPGSAAAIIDTALRRFGRVDCVVNNAGILRDRMFWKMSFDDWDSVLKVHLYGSYNVSRAAAAHFRDQQSGSLVHMTSTAGLVGNVGQANYSAAKLGIVAMSRSIAIEMSRFGVRSNCIAPFALTRMVTSIPGAESEEFLAKRREMTAAKVAPLAIFLSSEEASEVNGQVFAVRGNEVFLMSQSRPLRSAQRSEGWTTETIRSHLMPALKPSLYPLDTTYEVFAWDPL